MRKHIPINHCVGKFASVKNNKMIFWQSMLQRNYYYLLEYDQAVISYKEILVQEDDSEDLDYAPHILIEKEDKEQVSIVFNSRRIEKNKPKIEISKEFCDQYGLDCEIITEKSINEVLLSNLQYLYRFSRQEPTKFERQRILDIFKKNHPICIDNLDEYFNRQLIPKVYNMIFSDELELDLFIKIGGISKIKVKEDKCV